MRLTIWINAFIPRSVPGYTKEIMTGHHVGKTAIPLPSVGRPLNLFKDWHVGYLTDQRTFDTSPKASVRMRSLAEISLNPPQFVRQVHESSGTTEVNLKSGAHIAFDRAKMNRCSFSGFSVATVGAAPKATSPLVIQPNVPATSPIVIKLAVVAKAGDPLVNFAADIDYEGDFKITYVPSSSAVTVEFSGKLDEFPAFEAYASLNAATKALFIAPPPPGNTVTNLLGYANRPITGVARFP